MSYNYDNFGIPFIPGYSFREGRRTSFHRPQTLVYENGIARPRRPSVGIGPEPGSSHQQISDLTRELSELLKSPVDKTVSEDFIPAFVALDGKLLNFNAYFMEAIQNSPNEDQRVRHVTISYYLEDDTMVIMEPRVKSSGLLQGMRLKRHRLPKNEHGDFYHWTDLNIGIDLEVYGFKYHITDCNAFTEEFMASQGILLNDPEPMPEDPYMMRREIQNTPHPLTSQTSPSTSDAGKQFFAMDGKVLRFSALRDDSDSLYGDTWPVLICYHLGDDTVSIMEDRQDNSGREDFHVFLKRQKIPKKLKSGLFPSCILEVSQLDVEEYYTPKDFQLGQTITLLSHRFLLYNCNDFTKEYYKINYPDMEMTPTEIPKKDDTLLERKTYIPPHNGWGSPEDSLQNCVYLIPRPRKENVLKMFENDRRVLYYDARLESSHPEDKDRRFVLSYFPSNNAIRIFENPTRNSGFLGGKFLKKTRIPKPGSTVDNPEFYSPADFAIGATVEVFGHHFVLTDTNLDVLKYLESIASEIPSHTLDSVREKLGVKTDGNQPADQDGEEPHTSY